MEKTTNFEGRETDDDYVLTILIKVNQVLWAVYCLNII